MMGKSADRIIQGLEDARKAASCDHRNALTLTDSIRTVIQCHDCGSRIHWPIDVAERHREISERYSSVLDTLRAGQPPERILQAIMLGMEDGGCRNISIEAAMAVRDRLLSLSATRENG